MSTGRPTPRWSTTALVASSPVTNAFSARKNQNDKMIGKKEEEEKTCGKVAEAHFFLITLPNF